MTRRKLSYLQGTIAVPYKLPAEDHRLNHAMLWSPAVGGGVLSVRGGIVIAPGDPGKVSVVAGGVNINPFQAVIPGTLTTTQGVYEVTSDAVEFRAITAASSTEFRRGYVIARVYDQLNPGTGAIKDDWDVEVVYGPNAATAGAATLPPLPANSIIIREFAVSNTGVITLVGLPTWTAPRQDSLVVASEQAAKDLFAAVALPNGFTFQATDTGALGRVTATELVWFDTKWQTYTPSFESGVPMVALGNGILTGRYYRKGHEISVEFLFQVGSAGTNIGAGVIRIGYPTGYRPVATLGVSTYGTYCGNGRAVGASGNIVCTVVADSPSRKLVLVTAGDLVIQAGGGPTSIAAANTFVQGRCSYLTDFEA